VISSQRIASCSWNGRYGHHTNERGKIIIETVRTALYLLFKNPFTLRKKKKSAFLLISIFLSLIVSSVVAQFREFAKKSVLENQREIPFL